IGVDPKLRQDIRKTVSVKIQLWYDPQISAVTATSDFDLRDLRRKPMSVYVAISPGDIPRLRSLLRLFFDALVTSNSDATPEEDPSLTVQTLVLLDEFSRLGRQDILTQGAQYLRAYGIRLAFVMQSKGQLKAIYGTGGAVQDLFSNLGAEIIFPSTDAELAKEIEERVGDDT